MSLRAKSLQSCLTLCDPMDCSPPGSFVHRILQARILEWVAMPSPGDLPDPGIEPVSPVAPAMQADSLPLSHRGSPCWYRQVMMRLNWITESQSNILYLYKMRGIRTQTPREQDAMWRLRKGISEEVSDVKTDYRNVSTGFREGSGTPLQYSCLENLMDGGAW